MKFAGVESSFCGLFQRDPVKHLQDFQLPFGEVHAVQRLVRLDAAEGDRPDPFHHWLAIEPLESLPQREA